MLAEKIKLARIAKGISQETVALALQISQSAYSKIELKKTKINFEFLQEVAPILGLSTSELFNYGDADCITSKIKILEQQLYELQNIVKEQQIALQTLVNKP